MGRFGIKARLSVRDQRQSRIQYVGVRLSMRRDLYERAELTIKVGFIKRAGLRMREQGSAPGSRAQ